MYWTPAEILLLANVDEYSFTNADVRKHKFPHDWWNQRLSGRMITLYLHDEQKATVSEICHIEWLLDLPDLKPSVASFTEMD